MNKDSASCFGLTNSETAWWNNRPSCIVNGAPAEIMWSNLYDPMNPMTYKNPAFLRVLIFFCFGTQRACCRKQISASSMHFSKVQVHPLRLTSHYEALKHRHEICSILDPTWLRWLGWLVAFQGTLAHPNPWLPPSHLVTGLHPGKIRKGKEVLNN